MTNTTQGCDNNLYIDRVRFVAGRESSMRGKTWRKFSLLPMFTVLVVFFLWIDSSYLPNPDYEPYERIYHTSILGGTWEIFYVFVNYIFREIGLSYDEFRIFILIFSSSALWLMLSRLQPALPVKSTSIRAANSLLTFFVLAVFILEYFVIRVRAGFSIGLFCLAFFTLISLRGLLGWVFSGLFLVLALFTHMDTATVLLAFVGLPFVMVKWKQRSRIKKVLFGLVSVGTVFYLLYMLNSTFELRGEHIFSPLNPVRFAMLSIVPLILFFFIKNESSAPMRGGNAFEQFPSYFVRFYAPLAMGLALLYFSGQTGDSGEALVRFYTLSSFPALLSLRLSGSPLRAPISAYLLVINGLFFLTTLHLLPGQ